MTRPPVILFLLSLVAMMPSVFAHQDRIIALEGTALVGLPPVYSPAQLNAKAGLLTTQRRQMRFTPYLRAFFPDDVPYGIHVSASWYHDLSQLPPYILIRVYPNQKEDFSYQLLFNLDTLDLISVTIAVKVSPVLLREFPVAVSDERKKEISGSISNLGEKTAR